MPGDKKKKKKKKKKDRDLHDNSGERFKKVIDVLTTKGERGTGW